MSPEQREAVVREARSWLGTSWHHRGRIKGGGVDCGMLLLEVYERCGLIPHVEPGEYPRDWHMHQARPRYLEIVQQYCDPVTNRDPLPADIAVFRWGHCVSHGSIVISWPIIIHAYLEQGVVLGDAVRDTILSRRYAGCYGVRVP